MTFNTTALLRTDTAVSEPSSTAADSRLPPVLPQSERYAPQLMATHDFRYPDSRFRVMLLNGRALPEAVSLVQTSYSRLGYATKKLQEEPAAEKAITASLQAVDEDSTLGTLSVTLDGSSGLRAETNYPQEVAAVRRSGQTCEFTQLALDTRLAGREVLCSLFYVAYVFSHLVQQVKNLLIEVNPRHQVFYERMLGFHRVGEERMCERVGAPAVLLHLDFEFTTEQIERSRRGLSVVGTTLYRYAALANDENALIRRIMAATTNA